jgi:malonyl CoA-acyl carrier protein transacylase
MPPMASDTALLFPGQGSHAEGMEEPYRNHALLNRGIELLGYDPFTALGEGTRTQQPALFLCSIAEWDTRGRPTPLAAAGHSLGEYAALTAAGAIDFDDAVRLVDARSRAMADAAAREPGGMVALLGGDAAAVTGLGDELGLSVANDNAPGQIVLSGASAAVDAAAQRAGEAGARARRLDVGGAFHSPLMAPAADALRAALDATDVREPAFPVLSNGSAQPFADVRRELAENLLRPVRWRETLLALHALGATDFVECGPGAVLRGLVKRTLREAA